jgi:hypothetical protein
MAFEVKNEFVSKELEEEIKVAVRERRSVEQLLAEKKFIGKAESIEELVHILIRYMGVTMAIEFIFTANQAEWKNYREILVGLWDKISAAEQFNAKSKLVLGRALYQQRKKDLGMNYIRKAAMNSDNVKTAIEAAQAVKYETGNMSMVREILIDTKELAKSSDDYSNVASALFLLANDENESRKTFEKAINSANTFPEH